MKITNNQLKQIIKEELKNVMKENDAGFNPYSERELEDRVQDVYQANPTDDQVQMLLDAGFTEEQIMILNELGIIHVEIGTNKDLSSRSWDMNNR